MIRNLSDTARRMLRNLWLVILAIGCLGLGIIWTAYAFEPPLVFLPGLLVGGLLSSLKIILLERVLQRSADMEDHRAKAHAQGQFILRYFLTIAVLAVVVILRQYVSIIGAMAGILALQLSAYVTNWQEARIQKKRSGGKLPPPLEEDETETPEDGEKRERLRDYLS